ncbi:cleavage polyadenylation factor subunit fip1 [Bonamia ostreae]|uniref:Cleavage polyadenylation factor subunit fip1 n=1 Tax=Bonamia ostreae TaxID=126728 RepID=A0ABV2AH07_9EUKA
MASAENKKLYPSIYDLDIDSLSEKPWRKSGSDLSDYFNYGFNEESWRAYCARQVQMRVELKLEHNNKSRKRSRSRRSESYDSYSDENNAKNIIKPRYKKSKNK